MVRTDIPCKLISALLKFKLKSKTTCSVQDGTTCHTAYTKLRFDIIVSIRNGKGEYYVKNLKTIQDL